MAEENKSAAKDQPKDQVSTPATSTSTGKADSANQGADKPDSASSQNSASPNRSASNPSLPPEGSDVPNDGRTATGAQVGAPSSPASGSPTQAPDGNSAAVENQTNPNAGMGAQVIGTTPDRVTINNHLATILSDLEAMVSRVRNVFGVSFDTSKLEDSLLSARDWAAKELGLEKSDAGWVAAGSGNRSAGGANMPAAQSGQTDSQRKAAEKSSKGSK